MLEQRAPELLKLVLSVSQALGAQIQSHQSIRATEHRHQRLPSNRATSTGRRLSTDKVNINHRVNR
jgi:hypothetical protein